MNITLIHIPYWWDKKISSLTATIATIRPDIIAKNDIDKPIPLTPPITPERSQNKIESRLMLATNWNETEDPSGWLVLY